MIESAGPVPEQLLRQAQEGDTMALGVLLEMDRNYLQLLARLQISRRLRRKVDSADVVQETFLKAHRDFGTFQGKTEREWLAWLRQILAMSIAQLVRRFYGTRRRDLRMEEEVEAELDHSSRALALGLADKRSSPSHQAARREQSVILADALSQLPEHYREVIILSHMEGLSFPDVAQRMGRSLDSVKNLWARALARLRQMVGGGQ
jgi:RNA polymerase sigma-70 factor (ECF subfamily)